MIHQNKIVLCSLECNRGGQLYSVLQKVVREGVYMKKMFFALAMIAAIVFISGCSQPEAVVQSLVVEPGDIVLADGSIVKPIALSRAAAAPDFNKCKPIAVVIRKQEGNVPALCIGINPVKKQWCTDSSLKGYDGVNMTSIQKCENGVDAYLKLCEATEGESLYLLTAYAALNHCISYFNYDTSVAEEYSSGWYLPSMTEIKLAANDAVKRSLVMVNSSEFPPSSNTTQYWTSNQYGAQRYFEKTYQIWRDYESYSDKNKSDVYVLPVHILSTDSNPVAAPVILPEESTLYNLPESERPADFTISTATSGADIYYTAKNISTKPFSKYESPVAIDYDLTELHIYALAVKDGVLSPISKKSYSPKKVN